MIKVETTAKSGEYKVTTYKEAINEKGAKVQVEDTAEVVTDEILEARRKMALGYIEEEQKLILKLQKDIDEIDLITSEIAKK